VKKYFSDSSGKEVRIFHDRESKQVGFKPDNNGYKISMCSGTGTVKCAEVVKTIPWGEYHPVWSQKQKMLLFKYQS